MAVSLLTAHLDVEKDPMVRAETVRALGRLEDPSAQKVLSRILAKGPRASGAVQCRTVADYVQIIESRHYRGV